jgi:hypothetical protein
VGERTLTASVIALCIGLSVTPAASADDVGTAGSSPGVTAGSSPGVTAGSSPVTAGSSPGVVVTPVDPSDNVTDAAATACGSFAQVLDGSSQYYGDFADSFEGSDYNDPAVSSSNEVGRTALRESAAVAMQAASTPGLQPDIADPMRVWSLGATKLLVKMGLRIPGDSLNSTATEMNNQAEQVQTACAAAGTHA